MTLQRILRRDFPTAAARAKSSATQSLRAARLVRADLHSERVTSQSQQIVAVRPKTGETPPAADAEEQARKTG